MAKIRDEDTAFYRGQKAGSNIDGPVISNPFSEDAIQHNNFEVGRRFGATTHGLPKPKMAASQLLQPKTVSP